MASLPLLFLSLLAASRTLLPVTAKATLLPVTAKAKEPAPTGKSAPNCPASCVPISDAYALPPDDYDALGSTLTACSTYCLTHGYSFYAFFPPGEQDDDCYCYSGCTAAALVPATVLVYFGRIDTSCFNTLSPATSIVATNVVVDGIPGVKYKTCFTNTNDTFPIVYYPFQPDNFQPLGTDNKVSNKGTALGYVGPGKTFCFQFVNPAFSGAVTFNSPAPPLTLSSITVLPSSAGAQLLLYCSGPSFSPYQTTTLAKFTCSILNTVPSTVRNILLSCTGFRPSFASGINPDCTLNFSLKPGAQGTFTSLSLSRRSLQM